MSVEWEGRFEDQGDQDRLVAERPLLLAFHDGTSEVEYVRRDVYDALAGALTAVTEGRPGSYPEAVGLLRAQLDDLTAEARVLSEASHGDSA